MENKRGSHVGVILSFVIFVTFLVFLYAVLKPAVNLTGTDKSSVATFTENEIVQNTSSNLTTISVSVNSSTNPSENCIQLENFLAILSIPAPYSLIVKNETEGIQDAYYVSSLAVLGINRTSSENVFFKVYSSPEISGLRSEDSTPSSCISLSYDVGNYSIGTVDTAKYVFLNDMSNLINNYQTNYDNLKTIMKIPSGTEFSFDFVQSNGTIISAQQNISSSVNVFSENVPVQYVDNNYSIQTGFINIKVW